MGTREKLRTCRHNSMPFISGMARSVITTSGVHNWMASRAFFAETADCTVNPAASSARFSTRTICCSSSTTKILLPLSVITFPGFRRYSEADGGAAASAAILNPDRAAVRFYDTARDSQPHAQPAHRLLRIIRAKESLEDFFPKRRWD